MLILNLVDMLKLQGYIISWWQLMTIVIGGCHKAQNLTTCKASAIKLDKPYLRISEHKVVPHNYVNQHEKTGLMYTKYTYSYYGTYLL